MTDKLILIFTLSLLCNISALAGTSRANALLDYEDTWSIAIGGSLGSTVLEHNEVSSNSSYGAIGEDVRVQSSDFSLTVFKEFFPEKTWSLTGRFSVGSVGGSYESDGDNLSEFNEDLSSLQVGAGIGLNYNLYYYGLKLQPYFDVLIIFDSGEYTLNHSSGGADIVTTHEFTDVVAMPQIGLRSYDSEVGLMSYFSLGMPVVASQSLTATALVAGSTEELTEGANIKRAPLVFSLGFGAYF